MISQITHWLCTHQRMLLLWVKQAKSIYVAPFKHKALRRKQNTIRYRVKIEDLLEESDTNLCRNIDAYIVICTWIVACETLYLDQSTFFWFFFISVLLFLRVRVYGCWWPGKQWVEASGGIYGLFLTTAAKSLSMQQVCRFHCVQHIASQ